MKLTLIRHSKRDTYTIGKLLVDDVYFCDTLEDRDRGLRQEMDLQWIKYLKVYGKTAIPTGNYSVAITYSPKFHRELPLVLDVKGFDGIRIHSGNTENDTLGCILVGENKVKGKVLNSRVTFDKLMKKLLTAKDSITLEIKY